MGIAVASGTINVVGGFLVTDRMLGMFKARPGPPKEGSPERGSAPRGRVTLLSRRLLLFLVGLRVLLGPRTARRGMRLAAVGMALGVDRDAVPPRSATGP